LKDHSQAFKFLNDHHNIHPRPGQETHMPNLFRISVILVILTLVVHSHARDVISGKVIGVSDGDTITVLENRTQHRIRLYGIDAL
jgi:endonuclease YncB( thermonuclease family)